MDDSGPPGSCRPTGSPPGVVLTTRPRFLRFGRGRQRHPVQSICARVPTGLHPNLELVTEVAFLRGPAVARVLSPRDTAGPLCAPVGLVAGADVPHRLGVDCPGCSPMPCPGSIRRNVASGPLGLVRRRYGLAAAEPSLRAGSRRWEAARQLLDPPGQRASARCGPVLVACTPIAGPLDLTRPRPPRRWSRKRCTPPSRAGRGHRSPARRGDWVTRVLAARPMVTLGRYSYGIFLWHQLTLPACWRCSGSPVLGQLLADRDPDPLREHRRRGAVVEPRRGPTLRRSGPTPTLAVALECPFSPPPPKHYSQHRGDRHGLRHRPRPLAAARTRTSDRSDRNGPPPPKRRDHEPDGAPSPRPPVHTSATTAKPATTPSGPTSSPGTPTAKRGSLEPPGPCRGQLRRVPVDPSPTPWVAPTAAGPPPDRQAGEMPSARCEDGLHENC